MAEGSHCSNRSQIVLWCSVCYHLGSTSNGHGVQVFNILCEQPETVAAFLVPRIRTVVARNEAQRYIRYLTVWSALTRFITAPLRAQRFFDADGGFTILTD